MLESLRQYAGESLSPEERAGLEARHAKCYLALAEGARPHLSGSEAHKWAARLNLERDNLRAAIEWYLRHDPEGALRFAAALWWYWELKGHTGEGRRWLERAILTAEQAFPDLEVSFNENPENIRTRTLLQLKAEVLNGAGKLTSLQSRLDTALQYLEEALRIFRLLGDEAGEADTLYSLGYIHAKTGDLEVGLELCECSVALNRARGDEAAVADSLYNLSLVELFQGQFAKVRQYSQERLETHVRGNSPRGMATSLELLGMAALLEGDGESAGTYFSQALRIFESLQEWPSVARTQWGLGNVLRGAGRFEEAVRVFVPAMQISVETHNTWAIPYMLESFGYLAADQAEIPRGVLLLAASAAFRERHQEPLPPGFFSQIFAGYVEAARAALGETKFQAQWNAGLTISDRDAIEFALGTPGDAEELSL
jgi:tetratricopeptide (TPR) repeat protein